MRFLHEITLSNLLSFGPDTPTLELRDLNVFIGPNGSGKSNLVEAISFLRSASTHLGEEVQDSGGIADWLWKSDKKGKRPTAMIEVVVDNRPQPDRKPIRHSISFTESATRFELVDERIEDSERMPGYSASADVYFYYRHQHGRPVINVREGERKLRREDIDAERSILPQRVDPDQYPEITYLGEIYKQIRIYREWSFGRYTPARRKQPATNRHDRLEESFDNLGVVLNRIRRDSDAKQQLLKGLRDLYAGIDDFDVTVDGGQVQVYFQEGKRSIPATRLSDGTLRYLCLLAILLHPEPPPLVCIEEPELGLHPDVMSTLGPLLREASERTQLIVTTHSDELIDSLSETPEDVVVCEKIEGATTMTRLERAVLEAWLDKYTLGELWRRGDVGGNRW
jgi:predicted ATPase